MARHRGMGGLSTELEDLEEFFETIDFFHGFDANHP